ncbi:MAG: hypothetical protein B7Z75_02420 [Acidocella sp. 20-57-95]|nr:MAG: hypothetical protein B7Z75_02420 [Acidocella sp. 20-57-95]OYV61750.1 MAG: hypothetical protein B7Z71_04045 [Acidocella sp. 21-58-7]HQT63859.1 hypothetical protein [Acidocella sp.]
MEPKLYFHLVGYSFGLAAFAMIYWSIRPALLEMGRDVHLKALIAVHFFRYFGLTAMLPGVFNLGPLGFSQDYLFQIMAGDVFIALLALISFGLIQFGSSFRIGFAWLFNILGSLDYLNAAARVTPSIHDANILGPFGWMIITVFLPAWLVSHIAIFTVLISKHPTSDHNFLINRV